MRLSDLTSQTPKMQNPCIWTLRTLEESHQNPSFYSISCALPSSFGPKIKTTAAEQFLNMRVSANWEVANLWYLHFL